MGASRVAHDIERAMGDWVLQPPTLASPSALAELESRLYYRGGLLGLELLEPPPAGPLEGWAAHAAALVSRDGQCLRLSLAVAASLQQSKQPSRADDALDSPPRVCGGCRRDRGRPAGSSEGGVRQAGR